MKKVKIFQISENSENYRNKLFSSLELLEKMGLDFDRSDYKEVWSGEMEVEGPEDVFVKMQGLKPKGYKGHSLSVSDLVEIDGVLYYCYSYGFEEVTNIESPDEEPFCSAIHTVDTVFRSGWERAQDTEYYQYGDIWFEK